MARLTRVQQQARTRASVLTAAKQEFVEQGYALAKIDRIAERAELTRGAVYSNFPSKRALYLAVLVEMVEQAETAESADLPGSVADSLGAFARTWLERLPLVEDTASGGRLQLRSLVGVIDDEQGRTVLAQVVQLQAMLLAIGLESIEPESIQPGSIEPDAGAKRRVRLAELTLTLLGGSGFLAEMAPGFGDPFDRTRACEQLAGLDLADTWAPPHLPYVQPAEPCRDSWTPPTGLVDRITGKWVDLGADGLVTVLGAHRLAAAEEAVRSIRSGEQVTVALVTSNPAETGNLVRLGVSDLTGCLRRVFPIDTWRHLRLIIDDGALAASATGLTDIDDETETAVRVQNSMIVGRAHGRGAAYAAATVDTTRGAPSPEAPSPEAASPRTPSPGAAT